MKKNIAIFLSFIFLFSQTAKADFAVGLTGALHMFDVSGTETTRTSGEANPGSHEESVLVPEIFIETQNDNVAIGLAYIPTRDMGSKSRTDTSDGTGSESGTYKAQAELDNVIQGYLDYTVSEYAGADVYVKVGLQHATIVTLESLNSGSTYPNQDVFGYTLGVGAKGELPYANTFYKLDLTYTNFEDYEAGDTAQTGNKVVADLEDIALKASIGYKF